MLGQYLAVDPVLLRIAMVILAIAGGGGILIYLVAWVLTPPERDGEDLVSARPEGADTTRLIVGGALIAIGTTCSAWGGSSRRWASMPWDVEFPAVLLGIGIMLVSSARSGAGQVGLIVAGIVLTILLVFGTAIDIPLGGGVGDRTVRPSAVRIEPEYQRGIGKLTLDLTEVAFGAIDVPLDVRARVEIGQLVVIVPSNALPQVDAQAGIGNVRVYRQEEAGFAAELSAPAPTGTPAIRFEASVGIGEVRIDHG